ncbi:hypothetical protein DAPK24_030190 [Pichia kluyveri]|uniref:Uncharacterized protein n=1 Tax=Pichia kluyveri TaxID=36015 RepID=A0AAV5R721_PICKL|nr:hypothetical protein DAPK24_030190 [Pichia kluyveri]
MSVDNNHSNFNNINDHEVFSDAFDSFLTDGFPIPNNINDQVNTQVNNVLRSNGFDSGNSSSSEDSGNEGDDDDDDDDDDEGENNQDVQPENLSNNDIEEEVVDENSWEYQKPNFDAEQFDDFMHHKFWDLFRTACSFVIYWMASRHFISMNKANIVLSFMALFGLIDDKDLEIRRLNERV